MLKTGNLWVSWNCMVSNCNPRSRDLIGKKSSKAKKMSVLLGQRLQTSGQRWTAKSVSCPKIDKLDGQNQCRKCRTAFWAMFQSSFQSSFLSNVPLLNDSTVIIFFMVRLLLRLWLSNFRICSILQHLGQEKKNSPSAKQRPLHQQKILTSTLLPIIGIGRAFQNLVGRNDPPKKPMENIARTGR